MASYTASEQNLAQPEKWRIVKMLPAQACEHCHKIRTRKMCYLLSTRAGKRLIVGSGCLKLFLTPSVVLSTKPEEIAAQDRAHTTEMIDDPYATITRVIIHLCKSMENYEALAYDAALRELIKIRAILRGAK